MGGNSIGFVVLDVLRFLFIILANIALWKIMVSSLMMLYGCHQRLHIRCCWWIELLLSLHIFLIEFALSLTLHNFDDQLMFLCVAAIRSEFIASHSFKCQDLTSCFLCR